MPDELTEDEKRRCDELWSVLRESIDDRDIALRLCSREAFEAWVKDKIRLHVESSCLHEPDSMHWDMLQKLAA